MKMTQLYSKSVLIFLSIVCCCIGSWNCKPAEIVKKEEEKKFPFTIKIIQDGQTLEAKNGIIEMKQKRFKFDFGMYETQMEL